MPNLASLRYRIARLEGRPFSSRPLRLAESLPNQFQLGCQKIDETIGPLARDALHEVVARPQALVSACGFTCGLLNRAINKDKPIIWLEDETTSAEYGVIYPTVFDFFGIEATRLVLVRCSKCDDALKAADDSLRSQAASGVVLCLSGPCHALDFKATRRLHLAAQKAGIPVIAVFAKNSLKTSNAVTRWLIGTAPSLSAGAQAPGSPCFDVELRRNRFGGLGHWQMEWNNNEHIFVETTEVASALSGFSLSSSGNRPFNKKNIA